MALQKKIRTATGVDADYWKINRLEIYDGLIECTVDLYLSKEARDNNACAILSSQVLVKIPFDKKTFKGDLYAYCYDFLKTYKEVTFPFEGDPITTVPFDGAVDA